MEQSSAKLIPGDNNELPLTVFSDDLYMLAYHKSGPIQKNTYIGDLPSRVFRGDWDWKRIATASLIGACLGLGLGAFQMPRSNSTPEVIPRKITAPPPSRAAITKALPAQVVAPAAVPQETAHLRKPAFELRPEEAARLRARNRRLEALISVLKQRRHTTPEKKSVQEPATYLGQ